jgi:thiamine pyrophosphate-dependent acetolactate synthase large subunit-like protein
MHRNLIALGEDEWSEAKTFRYAVELGKENYKQSMHALYTHSFPYMKNVLVGVNFRIIDFYELNNYVPRREELFQSRRTDSYVGDSVTAEDVYVENVGYSLEELQQEVELYKDFMVTQERVTPDEWKEMTKGRFGSD